MIPTVTVNEPDEPAVRFPRFQVTIPDEKAPPESAEVNVAPGGSGSRCVAGTFHAVNVVREESNSRGPPTSS